MYATHDINNDTFCTCGRLSIQHALTVIYIANLILTIQNINTIVLPEKNRMDMCKSTGSFLYLDNETKIIYGLFYNSKRFGAKYFNQR